VSSHQQNAPFRRAAAALLANRLALGLIGGALLLAGAIATAATGSVWELLAALGVQAIVTVAVILWFLHATMVVGHIGPPKGAVLEEGGLADQDALTALSAEDPWGGEQRERTETARRHAHPTLTRRGIAAAESALSVGTLALLTGTAVVAFLVAVSFVFDGI